MAGKVGRPKKRQVEVGRVIANRRESVRKVSHDLRNELGAIVFLAGHLVESAPDGDSGRRMAKSVTTIQRMALRMGRLVDHLLELVGLEAAFLAPAVAGRAPALGEVRSRAVAAAVRARSLVRE
jgi:signal transduction histidine kinase